jgi:hypothetical protein
MLTQNLPDYWERLYSAGNDNWDLGKSNPSLEWFLKHPSCPKTGRVLVTGAGRGWDAEAWSKLGYETVAVDFCQTAVDSLDSLSRKYENLKAVDQDVFEIQPKTLGTFDVIYDYGCFSAIHPGRRDEMFEVWSRMLSPEGIVLAFFYPMMSGSSPKPPHPTSEGELMARLDGIFDVIEQIPAENSAPGREGKEVIWILKPSED